MKPQEIEAIDIHGHYGDYLPLLNNLGNHMRSATAEEVVRRALMANTCLTIVSPIQAITPPIDNDSIGSNIDAAARIPKIACLRYWVVIDPRKPETYEQAARMLRDPACVGIKIHPSEHGYMIWEHGEKIFSFAARHKAIVLSHSGQKECLPGEFVAWADRFPEMRLILAHLGFCWEDGNVTHQVRAIQSCKNRNMFVDTSSSASLLPCVIEWAVGEIGAERILFGTDTPLFYSPMMRFRIDAAEISIENKLLILRENAINLFGGMGKPLVGDECRKEVEKD